MGFVAMGSLQFEQNDKFFKLSCATRHCKLSNDGKLQAPSILWECARVYCAVSKCLCKPDRLSETARAHSSLKVLYRREHLLEIKIIQR